MILGLDISTSSTGWCVFKDSKFINMGYIDLKKIKDPMDKAKKVKDCLMNLILRYEISNVCIEQNLQAFRPGLSSAKTLLTLARFNGIVSYLCFEVFDLKPSYVNVNSARKACNIKLDRKSKKSTKEQIFDYVLNDMSINGLTYKWPKKVLKSGPRAGNEVYVDGCYDMSDSYVICKAYEALNN